MIVRRFPHQMKKSSKQFSSTHTHTHTHTQTEELVDWSLSSLLPDDTVLDVGTGTGCIGISLLCSSPSLKVYGVEPGDEARLLTMDNVERFKPEFEGGGWYMGVVGDTAEGILGRLRKGEMSEVSLRRKAPTLKRQRFTSLRACTRS